MVKEMSLVEILWDRMPYKKVILGGVGLMVIILVLTLDSFSQQESPRHVTIPLIESVDARENDLSRDEGVVVLSLDPVPFDANVLHEKTDSQASKQDLVKPEEKVLSKSVQDLKGSTKFGRDRQQAACQVQKIRPVENIAVVMRDGGRPSMPVSPSNLEIPSKIPYREYILQAAQTYGVDAALIIAIIKAESNYNPKAVSHTGARGLMQIMPGTARDLNISDSFDPAENIDGGVRYLRQMLDKFNGNERLALAAYNAGVARVLNHGGVPPFRETRQYIKNVLRYREAVRSAGAVVTELSLLQNRYGGFLWSYRHVC
jgi:hypothetical protein